MDLDKSPGLLFPSMLHHAPLSPNIKLLTFEMFKKFF